MYLFFRRVLMATKIEKHVIQLYILWATIPKGYFPSGFHFMVCAGLFFVYFHRTAQERRAKCLDCARLKIKIDFEFFFCIFQVCQFRPFVIHKGRRWTYQKKKSIENEDAPIFEPMFTGYDRMSSLNVVYLFKKNVKFFLWIT